MLYGIFRITFWGIVFALIFFLLIRKSNIARKRLTAIITLFICAVLSSVSMLFPIENLFINFESPKDVFNYYQKGKVDNIINGNDSSMIIYSNGNNSGGHYIVPKVSKGYKLPSLFSVKKVSHRFERDGIFDIYNVLGTNDYYVVGMIISKESGIDIVDVDHEPIEEIIINTGNTDTDIKTILIYSFAENLTSEYYLLINGEKRLISN